MSIPKLPADSSSLTREEAINLIISSIAMEEIGLSHIINSEGEKLQYVLGTLEGVTGLSEPVTVSELLKLNKSIRETLEGTMRNQMMLSSKLQTALNTSTMQGPTGATAALLLDTFTFPVPAALLYCCVVHKRFQLFKHT